MASYLKFEQFVEDMANKVHDLSADTLEMALTTEANAPANSNSILGDLTEINYTNLSARTLASITSAQTSGTYKLDAADKVLTASGAVATFRRVVLFNQTPSSPLNPLISHFDHGSDVTLANGETYTIQWNAGGIFTLV